MEFIKVFLWSMSIVGYRINVFFLSLVPFRFVKKIGNYFLIYQNLRFLGYDEKVAEKKSIQYVFYQKYRTRSKHFYQHLSNKKLDVYCNSVKTTGSPLMLSRFSDSSGLIILTHAGDYWLTIVTLMKMKKERGVFVFYRANFDDVNERRALESLNRFHDIIIFDDKETSSLLSLVRFLRKGANFIIFSDLPPNVGNFDFGSPKKTILLGREAYLCYGAAFLAAKSKCIAFCINSVLDEKLNLRIQFDTCISCNSLEDVFFKIRDNFESYIKNNPENWYFLVHVESYFHKK